MIRVLLLLFVINISSVSAGIEDHLKPISGKSDLHQMKNIDFIYMINLDQRPEKFEISSQRLNPYGIHPFRFSAVNGWELSTQAINDLGVVLEPWMNRGEWGTFYSLEGDGTPEHEVVGSIGKNYFCHCMSKGAIGIALSHLSILQDAYDSGYQTIWVMEDDISIVQDPNLLSDLIVQLDDLVGKNGWDILFTDRDTINGEGNYVPCTAFAWRPNFIPANPFKFAHRQDVGSDFRRIGARYGAYSMIVRRSGMKKLLDFFKNYSIFLPFDMDFTLPNNIALYTVLKDVVTTQPGAPSDNGGPNYKNRKE
jgi:GR25 family glycosyltransferase involved in LPS biosynthesis